MLLMLSCGRKMLISQYGQCGFANNSPMICVPIYCKSSGLWGSIFASLRIAVVFLFLKQVFQTYRKESEVNHGK